MNKNYAAYGMVRKTKWDTDKYVSDFKFVGEKFYHGICQSETYVGPHAYDSGHIDRILNQECPRDIIYKWENTSNCFGRQNSKDNAIFRP